MLISVKDLSHKTVSIKSEGWVAIGMRRNAGSVVVKVWPPNAKRYSDYYLESYQAYGAAPTTPMLVAHTMEVLNSAKYYYEKDDEYIEHIWETL